MHKMATQDSEPNSLLFLGCQNIFLDLFKESFHKQGSQKNKKVRQFEVRTRLKN